MVYVVVIAECDLCAWPHVAREDGSRTVGALARQSRAKDPLSAFGPACARVLALSLCSSMKFERSDSSFTVLAYAQDI